MIEGDRDAPTIRAGLRRISAAPLSAKFETHQSHIEDVLPSKLSKALPLSP